jgi:hypothetical protein
LKIKSQRDFWSGLMFVCIGIAFAWGATNYSFGSSAKPGPGFFPFGLAMLMALLGALVLFKSLTLETEGGDPIGPVAWKPLITILASVLVFGYALPRLGLMLSLPLLVLISSLAGEEFGWKGVLANCLVLTAGAWAIFVFGLKLALPLWPVFLTAG